MTRRPTLRPHPAPLLAGGQKCYYWLCASIVMEADDRSDPRAVERVHEALGCAQAAGCVRAGDCRELTLGALARLLRQRPRD